MIKLVGGPCQIRGSRTPYNRLIFNQIITNCSVHLQYSYRVEYVVERHCDVEREGGSVRARRQSVTIVRVQNRSLDPVLRRVTVRVVARVAAVAIFRPHSQVTHSSRSSAPAFCAVFPVHGGAGATRWKCVFPVCGGAGMTTRWKRVFQFVAPV